jgi:DNA polymerase-3 subunit alpha
MPGLDFVHLHVHSSYSLLEGALTIARLAELAKADRQPALALTDTDNMFGVLEFSEKISGYGIQPIVGCALAVDFGDSDHGPRNPNAQPERLRVVLLAARAEGYRSLMRLNSRAFLDSPANEPPRLKLEWLDGETDGIIALTGGPGGPLDGALAAGQGHLAAARLDALLKLFGDRLYIELQRHGTAAERRSEPGLVDLAYARSVPLVATNEPFFAAAQDYEAHDALICIAEGRLIAEGDRRQLTPEHRFKSRAEMVRLFADLPEAVASTVEIARRCAFRPRTHQPILPRFSVGDNGRALDEASELRRRAETGLEHRLETAGVAPGHTVDEYRERLDFELGVIAGMKYPGYFLIVSDFIQWAKKQGIPVGPGRGSGAGSLVSYALTITDLDPIRFGLLFERFLNPERVSMPDFDIDFCQDRRDEVIRYVQERYGRDQVAQIITFGTLQARGVLRDVGRVLQMPYGQVDKLCKLVPQNPAAPVSLKQAIEGEPRLQAERDSEPIVKRAFDIAQKLEGLNRHASTHAAGIVIGDRPLSELVPLYRDPKSDMPVTQFNMKFVESAGLVKFDFLGLKTLTVISTALKLIRETEGKGIDMSAVALDDEATYKLMASAETVGVFQFESSGMRDSLRQLKPDTFEDIIAMVALYRPGPMDNIPSFIRRKHGEEPADYLHPKIEKLLKETYGVIIYQEQVMEIAQILAGYSLGEADLLRRAMGKKIASEMDAQRKRFVEGATARDVPQAKAEFIFDLVAKFAGYGFNKSHAAAYALVAYHTAWLKANYPVEFFAASMTLDMGNIDKLNMFRQELGRLGIPLLPPDINASRADFSVEVTADGGKAVRYALGALKNVGKGAMEGIVAERDANGAFTDIFDMAERVEFTCLNKRAMENLSRAGAFDSFSQNRRQMFESVETVIRHAGQVKADAEGPASLFGDEIAPRPKLPEAEDWKKLDRLDEEAGAVGFYLTGHPLDPYWEMLKAEKVTPSSEMVEALGARTGLVMAGIVTRLQQRRSQRGTPFAFLGLSDPTGIFEVTLFSDVLTACREMLEIGTPVVVDVEGRLEGESARLTAQRIRAVDDFVGRASRTMTIRLDQGANVDSIRMALTDAGSGHGRVVIEFPLATGGRVDLSLPGRYAVNPMLEEALSTTGGVRAVEVV